jgi:tripartite-type tricarboxylate transporter receptor subunit TctC
VAITRGGIPHMATQLLRNRSGVDLTYVFYPGSSQAIGDVISGRVPVIVDGLAGPITGGQLKLLAIASPDRVASRPDIPTVAETVPGFVATGWFVLVAPPSTSAAIVRKVSEDLNAVLARPEVRQKLDALSISTRAISSEGLSKFIKSERELWKPVIQQLGLATQ